MFCDLDDLGLVVVGQHRSPERTVLECRVAGPDPWCRRCEAEGTPRDTVTRRLAHVPFGHRPTTLLVRVRRYKCTGCGRVWRQDTAAAAEPGAKLSRGGMRWALEAIVVDHLTVSRAAAGLGVGWPTANTAILTEGKRLLIDDPARFDRVRVIGVDEHVWRHTRFGDKYVTVLAGDALDVCRRRVQTDIFGRRGRKDDTRYKARRTLHTGAGLLTGRQHARLEALFAISEHVEVEAIWGIYQRMTAAYREPDRSLGKKAMQAVIDALASGVPAALVELRKLGRTLKQRAADVLAFFDLPGTSNGPTEAINGRLEHLRGTALGFRNLTHYITRSLLEADGFRPRLHP
ncbi:transposase [Streptomyces sp. NPDC048568]|uniref:transposase n=1 Tax=Streptomyces sp. NPDC048568 TaxID=3365571 RepID=UPI00371FD5B3